MNKQRFCLQLMGAVAALGLSLPAVCVHAAPDYEVHNTMEIIGDWASSNTDVLIGPNAAITVSGDWYITANNVYIHPTATITGTGTIHLMNPSTYNSKTAAATLLDAGSVVIGCKVSIENGSTVTLTAIDPATAYAGSGFTETAPQLVATSLSLTNNLNFNNTGAHLVLGNNDVFFGSGAPIVTRTDLNTAGFSPDPTPGTAAQAYIVTNGTGVVTKVLPATRSFSYPVGQSAGGDYTPAFVVNGGTAQNISMSVKDYAGSAAIEAAPAGGNGRSWLLYTTNGGPIASLALTHNTATNGSSYRPAQAAIVRQQSTAGVWSSPSATAYGGPLTPTGESGDPATITSTNNSYYSNMLVLGSTATSAVANAWYSKSSDVLGGIRLVTSGFLQGGMNTGNTAMRNDLQVAGILPLQSTTANSQAPLSVYSAINNAGGAAGAVTDWVEVQLRSAPGTIVERHSFLVKTNGSIVNPDGSSTLLFSSPPGNYHVVIDHRNHLPVMTGTMLAMNEATPATVDFRAPGTAVYNLNGANAARATAGSFSALWGGDVNHDGYIYYSDPANDRDALFSILGFDQSGFLDTYNRGDVNLDAFTYYSDPGNDRDFLFNILGYNQSGFIEKQVP